MVDPELPDASRRAQMEAIIEAEVTRAMAPYRRLDLPPEVLDELERGLRFALHHHPGAQRLVRGLMDDPVLARSSDVDTSGMAAEGRKKVGA